MAAAFSSFYGYKGGVLSPLPTNHSLPQGGAGALGGVGGLSSPAPVRLAASVADGFLFGFFAFFSGGCAGSVSSGCERR